MKNSTEQRNIQPLGQSGSGLSVSTTDEPRSACTNGASLGFRQCAHSTALNEIDGMLTKLSDPGFSKRNIKEFLLNRKEILKEAEKTADDDLFTSVLKSHKAVCKAKCMGDKEAFGHDPAVFYSLAVVSEAGEMTNKIVKAMRNGDDHEACRNAVISELPDVFIYSVVLSHVLDLDIVKLVSDKVKIVIDRAENGYYGGPLNNRST